MANEISVEFILLTSLVMDAYKAGINSIGMQYDILANMFSRFDMDAPDEVLDLVDKLYANIEVNGEYNYQASPFV